MRGFEGISMGLVTPTAELEVDLALPGIYNVYNALAAAGVATALDVPATLIKSGLESFTAAFGRAEIVDVDGQRVCLVLVKNPVGLNAVLRALMAQKGPKRLLFVLNDRIADGQDVSWIWDADFEKIAGEISFVLCSGLRAEDMALRLKYAGISSNGELLVQRDLGKALELGLRDTLPGETLYLLPTYTAMLAVRELLAKLGHLEHFWEKD
jgi:UDP-N-acetylmuramyl tripeptide synthase